MKLFHNTTWPYKSIINVHIHPIHFCVSCTYFLCGMCIGRMKGTHKRIYTVGLGSCLIVLSGIAICSFSPGSWTRSHYCTFIQCRFCFSFFCITVTHIGWKHLKCEGKTASLFMVYICLQRKWSVSHIVKRTDKNSPYEGSWKKVHINQALCGDINY